MPENYDEVPLQILLVVLDLVELDSGCKLRPYKFFLPQVGFELGSFGAPVKLFSQVCCVEAE